MTSRRKEAQDIRSMPIENLTGDRQWKDTEVKQCLCGCAQFWMLSTFDEDGAIGAYFLDMICAMCGAWYKAPIPVEENLSF